MTVVIISTLTFVLSTMPELAEEIDVVLFDNETETAGDTVERWDQVGLPLSTPGWPPICCHSTCLSTPSAAG